VKTRKDPEIESLSKLVKQQQLSSPPTRNPPPLPSSQPFIIEDLPTRKGIPLADGIRNATEQSIWEHMLPVEADYKLAIEESKSQGKAREERQTRNSELDDDDEDLVKAIKLAQEEELRRRELEEPNASSLFDDDPIQVPQFVDFNHGYQQRDKPPPQLPFMSPRNLFPAKQQDHINRDSPTPSLSLRPEERRVYGSLYRQADPDGIGFVTGEAAVKFFEKTRIEPRVLGLVCSIFSLCGRRTRLIILHRYGKSQIRRL
jgi:hypothetical protein